MISDLTPMLATAGELPVDDDGWAYEFKWDGMRCLVRRHAHGVDLLTRTGRNVAASFPELLEFAQLLPLDTVVDGEVVALDDAGRPDFALLQRRMNVAAAALDTRLLESVPVSFFPFDLLEFDGHDLRELPWHQRRRLLESAELDGPRWRVPPAFESDGATVLDAARRLSLEGVVAKRRDSAYRPGARSSAWRKIKLVARDEFVVVGWTEGSGRRQHTLGALLLAAYDGGHLRYVGSVGTGFDDQVLELLRNSLEPIESPDDPCELGPQRPRARWTKPELVVEVAYGEWTRGPVLRHPSFCGIRHDRRANEVDMPSTGRRERLD